MQAWIKKRFERRIIDANGCWLMSDMNPNVYVTEYGVGHLHRWSWEYHNERQMPKDKHAHHTCEVKGCWNPNHVVPLTPKEHAREHVKLKAMHSGDPFTW